VLAKLPREAHPDLLVGFDTNADAGVYRLGEGQALVQSVDFFTPVINDAEAFGAIAAANALSDLYAMGARPITALALVGFPQKVLGPEVLVEILQGGSAVVREAGAVIVGGHSVQDQELKYGLAVTGLVDPDTMRTNANAKPGDRLVLTKALGTGLIANAIKGSQVEESDPRVQVAIASMRQLNRAASEVFDRHGVRASTDVTGFGLLGHARYMADASQVGLRIDPRSLPVFELGLELAQRPLAGGSRDNENATGPYVDRDPDQPDPEVRLAYDAQTSGGLLACVPAGALEACLADLTAAGCVAAHIGEVTAGPVGRIRLGA